MSKLLIVESPKKASHIRHMLGSGWDVKATLGHIRDLPLTGESAYVRPPDFAMRYEILDTKHKEIVAGLRAAAKSAEAVYVATDPDREGEGIAWHVCQVLKIPPKEARRVSYQEVTETAIRKAIQSPRPVNMRMVAAQEARRALDRIVGWEVSPVLSRLLDAKASAGRVQTPALGLIVERERAIKSFKPTAFYQVLAHMPGKDGVSGWKAFWIDGTKEGEYFLDKPFAQALADALPSMPLVVSKAESKPVCRAPAPPFTTSSMQMDGARALKVGVEDIMEAAQGLFYDGHITYHRTDSPNLSEEGETLLRDALQSAGLPIIERPRRWKAKGDAQEAHEAIRPTFDKVPPSAEVAGEDANQRALYQLIRKRAMASQMPDAIYQQTSCTLDGGMFQNRPAIFKAVGSVLTDPGWKRLYQESEDEDSSAENEAANPVPKLQVGQGLRAERGEVLNKTTKAPPRYTEATLIKALEDHGVGRPSTYASIIKTLYKRDYMKRKGKAPALYPTELGESVVDALLPFDFAAVDYTREIEESLDKITEGSMNPRVLLEKSYRDLRKTLDEMPQDERNISCPVDGCGGTVRRMESKRQKGRYFWACSNRDAHALLQDDDGKPGAPFAERAPQSPESEGPTCPDCETPTGRFTTGNGHGYFRCPKGHGSWWDDNGALGKAWEPMPAGKGGKSVKKAPEKTGKPATRKRRSA
ncbi:MAG: type I DNA topoisomerase [Acidithiobacillus ferrivorans]